MEKEYAVYILTNYKNTVLYIGVTSNLLYRVFQHREKIQDGFTKRYNVDQLIYYEIYDDVSYAIGREKQLKKWSRLKKEKLITNFNADWRDLYDDLI